MVVLGWWLFLMSEGPLYHWLPAVGTRANRAALLLARRAKGAFGWRGRGDGTPEFLGALPLSDAWMGTGDGTWFRV